MQKAEPSLKKESPQLEICLLFITSFSKNLAGLLCNLLRTIKGKLSFHRTFLAGQDLKLGCPGRLTCPAKNINQLLFRSRLLSRT